METPQKLRQKLVRYGKKISGEGFVIGSGGNISAKSDDRIYVKARGRALDHAHTYDYIPIDLGSGRPLTANKEPSFELLTHLACYRARPGIQAVIHSHPLCATAYAMRKKTLPFVSYETMAIMGSTVPVLRRITPGTGRLAREVGRAIAGHNAVLLKNHGAVVVGEDLEEAFQRTVALERMCRIALLSHLFGAVSFIPEEELRRCFE